MNTDIYELKHTLEEMLLSYIEYRNKNFKGVYETDVINYLVTDIIAQYTAGMYEELVAHAYKEFDILVDEVQWETEDKKEDKENVK